MNDLTPLRFAAQPFAAPHFDAAPLNWITLPIHFSNVSSLGKGTLLGERSSSRSVSGLPDT